jgi:hypothetical protein
MQVTLSSVMKNADRSKLFFIVLLFIITTRITNSFIYNRPSCPTTICHTFGPYDGFLLTKNTDNKVSVNVQSKTLWYGIKLHMLNQQSYIVENEQDFSTQLEDNKEGNNAIRDSIDFSTKGIVDSSRRKSVLAFIKFSSSLVFIDTVFLPLQSANSAYMVLPLGVGNEANNHRQLELCLVILLRVIYWATNTVNAFVFAANQSKEQRRKLYLEARLCTKAMLTGKLGDGSTSRTYALSSLQVPLCLSDIEWYAKDIGKRKSWNKREYESIVNAKTMLYEGLASIVEFDGLDTLVDPSPRATLTLGQYTEPKFLFVKRTLSDIVLPSAIQIVTIFGSQPLQVAEQYTRTYYSNEVSDIIITKTTTAVQQSPALQQEKDDSISSLSEDKKDDDDYDGSY